MLSTGITYLNEPSFFSSTLKALDLVFGKGFNYKNFLLVIAMPLIFKLCSKPIKDPNGIPHVPSYTKSGHAICSSYEKSYYVRIPNRRDPYSSIVIQYPNPFSLRDTRDSSGKVY